MRKQNLVLKRGFFFQNLSFFCQKCNNAVCSIDTYERLESGENSPSQRPIFKTIFSNFSRFFLFLFYEIFLTYYRKKLQKISETINVTANIDNLAFELIKRLKSQQDKNRKGNADEKV